MNFCIGCEGSEPEIRFPNPAEIEKNQFLGISEGPDFGFQRHRALTTVMAECGGVTTRFGTKTSFGEHIPFLGTLVSARLGDLTRDGTSGSGGAHWSAVSVSGSGGT